MRQVSQRQQGKYCLVLAVSTGRLWTPVRAKICQMVNIEVRTIHYLREAKLQYQ